MSDAVDYERIADRYERRYATHSYASIGAALKPLAASGSLRALEVGCGTGHWLRELGRAAWVAGVDPSPAMLSEARRRDPGARLVRARANGLPFAGPVFDLVFCVHALHHFEDPHGFVKDAARLLRTGGRLAIVGLDPHVPRERWYVYQYFEGTWETDLRRYPRWSTLAAWMSAAGLVAPEVRDVEHIRKTWTGADVLHDSFIDKGATSQLALLSDEAYATGVEGIRAAVRRAADEGTPAAFAIDLVLKLAVGRRV